MYYFLKKTRFDYGNLEFFPPDDEYWDLVTIDPPVKGTTVKFRLTSPITRKLDADYIRANRGILCSKKLKELLEGLDADALFYPAQIYDRTNELVNSDYFLLHVSNKIDCLNYNSSIYQGRKEFEDSGFDDFFAISKVEKIVLDEKKIGLTNIFYISNSPFRETLGVNEIIGKSLSSKKLKGLSVISNEDFTFE